MEQYGEEKNRASWATSLATVKGSIIQPKRNHEVKVKTKTGSNYSYKYADLADVDKAIMDAVRETKDKNGHPLLTYFFDIDNGKEGVSVETFVIDAKTGFMVRMNRVWFKNFNVGDAQKTASLISYAKRYSLSASFGIASEDDDDTRTVAPQAKAYDHDELQAIWNSYIHDHSETAKQWLFERPHDGQTVITIKKWLDNYNKKNDKPNKPARKKPTKKADAAANEAIKKIVDGNQDDSGHQDLFGDITGE